MRLEAFFEKFDLFADAPGAVAKMRELVLQMAVTGKLVHQDKHDEPASSLLASAEAERAMLVTTRKIKDRSPKPIELNDQPFKLPSNWAWARLSDIGHELGQKVPDKRFTYIDVGGIDPDTGRISDRVEKLEPNEAPSRARKLVTRGTVIYSTVRPYLLNIAIVDQDFDPEPIASTAFGILHPFAGINNRYLFYWLRSEPFTAYVQESMKGMAYPAINDEKFYKGFIALPPLAEQKRIVGKVDELMALCDRLEAQQQERGTRHAALTRASLTRFAEAPTPTNLQFLFHPSYTISPADLRKSILTLAVQGKLVPQDPSEEPANELLERLSHKKPTKKGRRQDAPLPSINVKCMDYELPDNWAWARFRDIASIASNLVNPKDYLGFIHLAPDNIERGNGVLLPCATVLKDKVISSNHRFYPGQIVYSKIRPNLAKVVVVDFEGLCSADMYPIDPLIDAFYLQRYMLSDSFLIQAVKSETRVAMPKINQMELNAIVVPVPPLAEQRRIVTKVDQLMALVDQLDTQLETSRTTAAKLMDALVAELTALH